MGHPYRDVVDREVAERILAERDALVTQVQRAREALGALQRRLELRESENAELRYALESRQQPNAELEADLARLRHTVDRLQVERDQAVRRAEQADRAREQARNAIEDLQAERDQARTTAMSLREQLQRAPAPADSDRAQRLAADLANLRRRREQDIRTEVDRVRVRLLAEVADIRDSLERALAMEEDESNPWVHGLRGVLAQVDGHLRREGVELVGQPGEIFDPHLHEAVAQGDHPEGRSHVVLDVLRPGLRIPEDELLVRPATVVISR